MWDGKSRFGKPRTNEERKKRHQSLYGDEKLPPRGTGKLKARLQSRRLK